MNLTKATMLAALTAAIAIAPLASAEAHKRHRHGGDVVAALALGLFAAGVASRAHRHHHVYRHGRNCYGLPYRAYHRCMGGYHYRVPRGHHPHAYYGGWGGGRHILKNGR